MGEVITFLGTAGARFMVSRQILASGGMWFDLNGTEILVDPGPGCIVQVTKRKLNPATLSGIIVSHRHLDHAHDVNIMVEAMTQGGLKQHGLLFAPSDALGPEETIILPYLKRVLEGIIVLKEGGSYSLGNVSFSTPVRHLHGVETYGLVFDTGRHTFSYIADSRFFEGICQSYKGDLLIMNIVRLTSDHPFDHLSVEDAEHIIGEIKPRVAIMTHFGMTMWHAKPWLVAEKMTQDTGIPVIAARDGMKFDLDTMEVIKIKGKSAETETG
ncbi:MAG: MBL fold metallo-hydrolase [Chloroflexi bacterium]|nr:MBL fold metallo-hydrolase [Chloroflexota bacterium]